MKLIYFPFTFISKATALDLFSLFGQIVVYQPLDRPLHKDMEELKKNKIIEIRVPVKGNENELNSILETNKFWIDSKQNYDSVSQIKAEILQKQKVTTIEEKKLLKARLFLQLAYELDVQDFETKDQLKSFENIEQKFMMDLTGGDMDDISQYKHLEHAISDEKDSGSFMTYKRLSSWAHLMACDSEASNVFITDSKSVFYQLIDDYNAELLTTIPDAIKNFNKEIEQKFSLTFSVIKDKSPIECFCNKNFILIKA